MSDLNEPNDDLTVPSEDDIVGVEDDPLVRELRRTQQAIHAEREERKEAIQHETQERKKSGRRSLFGVIVGIAGATLAIWLSVSAVETQRTQDRDRASNRLVACQDSNEKQDAIAGVTRALLNATAAGDQDREPRTPEEQAARDRALKIFLEDQGLKMSENGKVLAPYMDCKLFQENPARARAQRSFAEHPPE